MTKKFSLNVLVYVIGAILLVGGIAYIVSASLTGDVVAPNGSRCKDSDGGLAIDLAGRCLQYSGNRGRIERSLSDECWGTTRLIEYYCNQLGISPPTCAGQLVTCPNGCGVYPEGSRCN